MNKAKTTNWIKYWRNTLADLDRKVIEINSDPIVVDQNHFINSVPDKRTRELWISARVSKDKKYIPVDISPCSTSYTFTHGKQKTDKIIYPFWIPAFVDRKGNLFSSQKDAKQIRPFFVRDYLKPNPKNYYQLSSIKEVDDTLNNFSFKTDVWEDYWKKCESFFKTITEKGFSQFSKTHEIYIQLGEKRNLTGHILNLYEKILSKKPNIALFENLIKIYKSETIPLPDFKQIQNNKYHIGQMDDEFPLSKSQRESFCAFSNLNKGEILAINGPPGTGKTTLIKSFVANLVIESVLNNKPPFLLMASSTNNQAITNILDSFKNDSKELFTERWLPKLDSFGLYFSSNNDKKYQTVNNCYGLGFINDYENRPSSDLEHFYLNNFVEYFGKKLSISECKSLLLKEVKSVSDNIKKYLEIASMFQENNKTSKPITLKTIADKIKTINTSKIEFKGQTFFDRLFFFLSSVKQRRTKILTSLYNEMIEDWDNIYKLKLQNLYIKTKDEYKGLTPIEDINVRLDISLRNKVFWLAIHYREAHFLELLKVKNNKEKQTQERTEIPYKERLQRIACITPMFISTFHSLPKFATYFKQKQGELPYFELFDYLIVDEAGQVAPDIAIPSFSLAKKAIVVGDINQIEPVWSTGEAIDIMNLKANELVNLNSLDDEISKLKDTGLLCSSGNLMKMSQSACAIGSKALRGTLLKEHRRCLDDIISYSNKYVYSNQLIPKNGKRHYQKHILPCKGYMNIPSESEKKGTSRVNPTEAIVIAKWIDLQADNLISDYGKSIDKIIAVLTPYKSQSFLIKKELLKINKKYHKITTGTVHSLQGAERDIIIMSTVISNKDSSKFINKSYNMLNVAVSRAKHSFLVFGNTNILDYTKNNPLGNLKKWLLEEDNPELSNNILYIIDDLFDGEIKRISTLKGHINTLKRAFEKAREELIIVSPFISINAIQADNLKELIISTVRKGVKITVITDDKLDLYNGKIKPHSEKGRRLLEDNGVNLITKNGIHSKTIIIDDSIIIEGSFNWLSATRNSDNAFSRYETSIVLQNEQAYEKIKQAKKELNM